MDVQQAMTVDKLSYIHRKLKYGVRCSLLIVQTTDTVSGIY